MPAIAQWSMVLTVNKTVEFSIVPWGLRAIGPIDVVPPMSLKAGLLQFGPLSLWERVRVRVIGRETLYLVCVSPLNPHPQPLSQRERGDRIGILQKSS